MTELNLETVVLNGVRVASDNVIGLRMASEEAGNQVSAVVLSLKRHLATKRVPDSDDGPRFDSPYGVQTAPRAGRLARFAGAPNRRSPGLPGRSLRLRGARSAYTLPLASWRTLPFAACGPRLFGTWGCHPALHLQLGTQRHAGRRIHSPRLAGSGPDAMQVHEGMQATLRGE
jgi:hypothetical protein